MNRKIRLLIPLLYFVINVYAQGQELKKDRIFNWGVKTSLNSVIPFDWQLKTENLMIQKTQVIYKVGYSVELLSRVNINRFYIQPSVIWKNSQADMRFDVLQVGESQQGVDILQIISMKMNTLEAPIVIGYNIVKEAPYALSIMSGIKLKYDYKTSFLQNNSRIDYQGESTPYHMALYSALEVVIGKLTFDFGYEFGYDRMQSHFLYNPERVDPTPITLKRRLNGINMSVGILF